MASETVRIRGLKETLRALNKVNKEVRKRMLDELKKAGDPIARDAQQKLARYPGASLGTIGPRASAKGVFVTQRARKVTGLRGDFGALQMSEGLIPALAENEDKVVDAVEDALDRLTRSAGF